MSGKRDVPDNAVALAGFPEEGGRIPGEDEEFAAELRQAMAEEERHRSHNHFARSLMADKWCRAYSPDIQTASHPFRHRLQVPRNDNPVN